MLEHSAEWQLEIDEEFDSEAVSNSGTARKPVSLSPLIGVSENLNGAGGYMDVRDHPYTIQRFVEFNLRY